MGSSTVYYGHMTAPRIITEEDNKIIVSRYKAGEGLVDLARAYKVKHVRIKSILEAQGITPRRSATMNTPIELRLHDALRYLGIGFTTQCRLVGRYVVDVKINQADVVIEADGAWHRASNGVRDQIRDAAHVEAGYQVFRFDGSRLNTDAVACVQEVVDACNLTPDESPIYDVRTRFAGPDHPRWKGSIKQLKCECCKGDFEGRVKRRFCSKECYRLFCLESGVLKGKPKSPEHRAKISAANRTRIVTEETREKIRRSRIGKPTTAGIPKTAEQKAKISAALKGNQNARKHF